MSDKNMPLEYQEPVPENAQLPEPDQPATLTPQQDAGLELGRILAGAPRPPDKVWEEAKQRHAERLQHPEE